MSTGLSGDTKIGDWFDHPQGGPVLREMLEENGQNEAVMKPVRRFAMKRLIKMSKGQFTQEIIDELVAKAEAYVPDAWRRPPQPSPRRRAPAARRRTFPSGKKSSPRAASRARTSSSRGRAPA